MKRAWTLLLPLVLLIAPLRAQETTFEPPLLAVIQGELYRVEGDALRPYDACQPEERLGNPMNLAPDGEFLVMATIPPLIDAALAELGTLGGTPFGLNLWLCDLRSDSLQRIYAVPGGDDDFTGEPPAPDVINSRPVWSPQGDALAWTVLDAETQAQSLLLYDVATESLEEMPLDAPLPFGFFAPPELRWGAETLYFTLSTLNEETFLDEERVYVVDPDTGAILSETLLATGGEQDDFIVERLPILGSEGEDYLALRYFQAGWLLADLRTGEQRPLLGLPERYSLLAPDGLSLLLDVDENYNYNWDVQGAEQPIPLAGYPLERIAIAPDGQAIAYADSVLNILGADGTRRQIAGSDGFADDFSARVFWGALAWRVPASAAEAQAAPSVCEGAQPSRLQAEEAGRVISESVPMNVRTEPTTNGALVGQIPGGASFTVLETAVCAEGYAWVRVRYGDLEGWVAESSGEYFLEPAQP